MFVFKNEMLSIHSMCYAQAFKNIEKQFSKELDEYNW